MIHRFSSHLPGVKPLVECNRTLRTEKVEPLPSQAPFSQRLEEIVGQACECAGRWRDGSIFRRAPYAPSICGIWSGGRPAGANLRYGKWDWMRFLWAKSRSCLAGYAIGKRLRL